MPRFRKRPVVVEAHLWYQNGDHPEDGSERHPKGFLTEGKVVRYFRHPDVPDERLCEHCAQPMHYHGWIDTKQGGHTVCPGDWIIREPVTGEFYPCKPAIFMNHYEYEDGLAVTST